MSTLNPKNNQMDPFEYKMSAIQKTIYELEILIGKPWHCYPSSIEVIIRRLTRLKKISMEIHLDKKYPNSLPH